MNSVNIKPIAYIESPYKEKFAIPRQPGLVKEAKGKVFLIDEANNIDLVRGLEQFSHIWLLFIFNATQKQGWKPLVKPPRLGGNKKMGVLATRSTFRPNPIGISAVELNNIEVLKHKNDKQQIILHVSGIDLLDRTPIVDIKPYLPYSDLITHSTANFAQNEPEQSILGVKFSKKVENGLQKYSNQYPDLALLIKQVLEQDPRPAYKKNKKDDNVYGMVLYNLNIQWKISEKYWIEVIEITPIQI